MPDSVGTTVYKSLRLVLLVEVDVIDPQALKRCLTRVSNIVRVAEHAEPLAILSTLEAELRRDDDPVAAALHRLANQLLVRKRAVTVSGVEQIDAELDGTMDRGNRLALGGYRVEVGHVEAAQTDRGYLEALLTEATSQHHAHARERQPGPPAPPPDR